MNSHRLEDARNEISFRAGPLEIILRQAEQSRVERLWVFDIFRMAAKFNLKSGGALGGRSTSERRLQAVVSRWEGAFVVPLLFTFGSRGVRMLQLQNLYNFSLEMDILCWINDMF